MKVIRFASTAAFVLLFGAMMPVYAQHEGDRQDEKAKPQEQHAQQPQRTQQPAPQQHAAQPRQQEQPRAQQPTQQEQPRAQQPRQQEQPRAAQAAAQQNNRQTQQARQQPQQTRQQPERTQQQARSWQQQKGWTQGGGWQGHATFAQDRSQNWASDHRTWGQRGGYGGYFIPQAQFDASFGLGHSFRLGFSPVLYQGYPEFSYGGFSFLMVDPWPGDWSGNWYSSDDVYIDYNDGYYLHNRRHPQEALALTIQL